MGKRSIFEMVGEGKNKTPKYIWDALPKELILDKNVSDKAYRLYSVLTTYINVAQNLDERVFPSFKELLEVTGWRNDKLSEAIEELVQKGWIGNITNPKRFNFQNNYYLNNTSNVNEKLVANRNKKHENMSAKTKERLAKRKLEAASPKNESKPEIEPDAIGTPIFGSSSTPINESISTPIFGTPDTPENPTRNIDLKKQDLKEERPKETRRNLEVATPLPENDLSLFSFEGLSRDEVLEMYCEANELSSKTRNPDHRKHYNRFSRLCYDRVNELDRVKI